MRFERHARTRFISSKSTLVNFQQGWKKKPQVAMKLPDFCLAPLESSLLSKLLYPPPNPSVGCWDPRAWSVYHSKRPTYACAKNEAALCLFMSFSIHYNTDFRAKKRAKSRYWMYIYEPNIKSARYGEQEERVLARIISKIKEFILYYGFTKATLQRRENQEIGGVLARECGRNWTL